MNPDHLQKMQNQFDALAQQQADEPKIEFWFARDLQEPLGYSRWENFLTAIQRSIKPSKSTVYEVSHHFRGVTKMVPLVRGSERPLNEFRVKNGSCR